MKRCFILLLIAFLTLGMLPGSHGPFSGPLPPLRTYPPLEIFRANCVVNDAATTSPVTISDITIPGVSASDSVVVYVGVIVEDTAATFTNTAATVDGNAATEIVDEDGTGAVNSGFWRFGPMTNADVVSITLSFSEAITSAGACVWAVKNPVNAAPVAFIIDDDTASAALVLTTTRSVIGGYVFCVSAGTSIAETAAWAVVTEIEDTQSAEMDYSTAQGDGTGSSMANTVDWSAASDASGACISLR